MALRTTELLNIIHSDPKSRKHFAGVFPANTIPQIHHYPAGFILNLDNLGEQGSHWVGLWLKRDGVHATYFDSFGLPPLNDAIFDFLKVYKCEMNAKTFQHLTSSDCGYYTILFIILSSRGYPLSAIKYLFYELYGKINDKLVKDYIKFFTGWKSIKKGKAKINLLKRLKNGPLCKSSHRGRRSDIKHCRIRRVAESETAPYRRGPVYCNTHKHLLSFSM